MTFLFVYNGWPAIKESVDEAFQKLVDLVTFAVHKEAIFIPKLNKHIIRCNDLQRKKKRTTIKFTKMFGVVFGVLVCRCVCVCTLNFRKFISFPTNHFNTQKESVVILSIEFSTIRCLSPPPPPPSPPVMMTLLLLRLPLFSLAVVMCALFCRCRCPCIWFLCLRMREWQTMNGTQLDLSRNVHATLSLLNVRSWDIYQTCKLSKVLLLLFLENCKRESLLNNLHYAHCKSAPNHLWKTAEHQTKTNTHTHTAEQRSKRECA